MAKINLKLGIEIHQQLETHKLFCNCPSILRDDQSDIIIKRKLRPVVGELGKIDTAALYELKKGKYFAYETFSDTNCLVELDEEPPHEINKEALKIALEISLLLNAKIVDQIQIMRKTVIDGSNTSGFQRTALIATNGFINTSKGKIGIQTICLEEDAARKVKETNDSVIFRLDRLGIPLIEIATTPDIKSPEHAKEVAETLGMILRSTNKVKHGIGTIRQDINISISNQPRVEIKGFQDLRVMPKTIENEIQRQLSTKLKQSEVRKANPDATTNFLRPLPGSARMYPETDCQPIIIDKKLLSSIKLPELIIERTLKLEKKYNLNPEISCLLVKEKIDFEKWVKKFPYIQPTFIAQTLILIPKEIKKRYKVKKKLAQKDFEKVFYYLNTNKVSKDAIHEILADLSLGKKIDIKKYKTISDTQLKKDVKEIIEKNKGASLNALMGEVMKKYRGKIDGKKAMEILKHLL